MSDLERAKTYILPVVQARTDLDGGIHATALHKTLFDDPKIRQAYNVPENPYVTPSLQHGIEALDAAGILILAPETNRFYLKRKF